MTDREYVESVWGWAQVRLAEPFEGIAEGKWTARLPLLPFSQVAFDTESEALAAAAEFTRTREQQIAEVLSEIELISDYAEGDRCMALESLNESASYCGRQACTFYRILARLESIKAELQLGMLAEPRKHEGEVKP